jgi:hypothetical protein
MPTRTSRLLLRVMPTASSGSFLGRVGERRDHRRADAARCVRTGDCQRTHRVGGGAAAAGTTVAAAIASTTVVTRSTTVVTRATTVVTRATTVVTRATAVTAERQARHRREVEVGEPIGGGPRRR